MQPAADSQKEVLEALNGSKTSLAPKKAVEVPAAEKAIPAANEAAEVTVAAEKNRKKVHLFVCHMSAPNTSV